MDWDTIESLAPVALSVAGSVIGTGMQVSGNKAASKIYADGTRDATTILNTGADAAQAELESGTAYLQDVNRKNYQQTGRQVLDAANDYGYALDNAVGDYADQLFPVVNQYGQTVLVSADQFASTMQPYSAAGMQALGETTAVANLDPRQLTLEQQRTRDDTLREATAAVAASGLRGAGRAGVAAIGDTMAGLAARQEAENIARKDAARTQLLSAGLTTTGKVAANTQEAQRDVAGRLLTVGSDVANKALAAKQTGSQAAYTAGNRVADLTGQYYSNAGDIGSALSQIRADTITQKANNEAAGVGGIAANAASTRLATAGAKASAAGAITNQLANYRKAAATPESAKALPGTMVTTADKPLPWLQQGASQ